MIMCAFAVEAASAMKVAMLCLKEDMMISDVLLVVKCRRKGVCRRSVGKVPDFSWSVVAVYWLVMVMLMMMQVSESDTRRWKWLLNKHSEKGRAVQHE